MTPVRTYGHFIDGAMTDGTGGEAIERASPAHRGLLARFAAGGAKDVDAAVTAARRTFDAGDWAQTPGSAKAAVLNRWADLIERDLERLSAIEAEETGKPIRFARGEVGAAVEITRYAAALAWQMSGDALTHLGADKLGLVTREPRGVAAMIVPWNFPLVTLFQKLPYALAAGCAIVAKPSELTSGTALEAAMLSVEAGVPAGIVNVVTGTGEAVGDPLVSHPDVDMVSFTGSTRVGKGIARKGADGVKRIALELGGKGANIVFADADLDAALDGVLFGFVLNQGEECCAGSRLLVEETIADDFVSRLVERSGRVRVGLPLDEDADLGALIHEGHARRVLDYVEAGKAEGARLVAGGRRETEGDLAGGCFIGPTIFTGVTPAMSIFREEIFGPVLGVTAFRTWEEAVALANDTSYGLANGVWTKDVDRALAVSRRLRSGTVYVNTYLESAVQLPFGGFKQSGMGRENGLEGLHEFTELKSTFIKLGPRTPALAHTI